MNFFPTVRTLGACAALACSLLATTMRPAAAQTAPDASWWIRAGAAWVDFDEKVDLSAAGSAVPGANASVKNNSTVLLETGYRLSPSWSLGLTVGYPPTTTLTGTGSVTAVGKVGEVHYAPAALTLQYRIDVWSRYGIYPYVGAGVTYVRVFSSTDGNVSNFHADSAWGRLLQAGVEYKISDSWGLFLDIKKFVVSTTATGNLGPAPVTASVRLDPLVTTAGVMFHF